MAMVIGEVTVRVGEDTFVIDVRGQAIDHERLAQRVAMLTERPGYLDRMRQARAIRFCWVEASRVRARKAMWLWVIVPPRTTPARSQ